jgi:hypothetical protein
MANVVKEATDSLLARDIAEVMPTFVSLRARCDGQKHQPDQPDPSSRRNKRKIAMMAEFDNAISHQMTQRFLTPFNSRNGS